MWCGHPPSLSIYWKAKCTITASVPPAHPNPLELLRLGRKESHPPATQCPTIWHVSGGKEQRSQCICDSGNIHSHTKGLRYDQIAYDAVTINPAPTRHTNPIFPLFLGFTLSLSSVHTNPSQLERSRPDVTVAARHSERTRPTQPNTSSKEDDGTGAMQRAASEP